MKPRRLQSKQRGRCQNYLCNVPLAGGRKVFCPSCRYMAKRSKARFFPVAAVIGGIIWGIVERVFF